MTSMELFPRVGYLPKAEPTEWGTGILRGEAKENVWVPKRPTWHYSGEDVQQKYDLTSLKRSHVRMTDQLLPNPEDIDMGPLLINKPFPAEHPYSSHIPRNALIPKFDSPQDPKRGLKARTQPINDEMPASPYDVTIVSKTKGFGQRYEIQSLPQDSEKRPLVWLGEDGFNQLVKCHGGRQEYYPYPPKLNCPNLQERSENMTVTPKTANALRNVERNQWQTSYNLSHTGLGESNVMTLDNYDTKMAHLEQTGEDDDNLYPRSTKTFDPPRPVEGRIARRLTSLPDNADTEKMNNTQRKKTLNQIEEERLLKGTQYVNLPVSDSDSEEDQSKAVHQVIPLISSAVSEKPNKANTKLTYLDTMKESQDERFQEIEAQNRWKDLEVRTPQNDVELLNLKYNHANTKEHPKTFYDHERVYNEERCGLYQTSYDPYRLYNSMNEEETAGPIIMDTSKSHLDTSFSPYNDHQIDIEQVQQIQRKSKPSQKEWLQPTVKTASVKTQEGDTILKDSTQGGSFNVKKFLQENQLPRYAKRDPQLVMSCENQVLKNVSASPKTSRPSAKSVHFEDDLDDLAFVKSAKPPNTIQYTSRHASWKRDNENHDHKTILTIPGISENLRRENTMPAVVRFSDSRPITSASRRNTALNFQRSNTVPFSLSKSFSGTPSSRKQPGYDLDFKDDGRFDWMPGFGTPRPQTTLLKIQESFNKSDVHKKFHGTFNESAPDLRHSIQFGKKHNFDGVNAQVLRG